MTLCAWDLAEFDRPTILDPLAQREQDLATLHHRTQDDVSA